MAHRVFSRRSLLRSVVAAGAGLVAGCSPFALINGLAPAKTHRANRDLAYGPHPRHRLDLYRPSAGAAAPVAVFFYGGNWHTGNRGDYLFAGEALASRGIVAVVPDYRLYPEVRFPAFLEDCARAVAWTQANVAQFGGDPRRLVVVGHSAGAYNAAMLALDPAYLRAAGMAPGTLRGLVGLAGPYDFLPLQSEISRAVFGFPDTPAATQPINFVTAAAPPTLLASGANDQTVDPRNSARLAAQLRRNGVPVREIVYPRLGHSTLIGALAVPLRAIARVLDDVARFILDLG